ncbi:MAG: hypothetical protein PHQ89_00335 [Bacilli bacterium]|nr:hypothetical protein [Bacilli bacterium]
MEEKLNYMIDFIANEIGVSKEPYGIEHAKRCLEYAKIIINKEKQNHNVDELVTLTATIVNDYVNDKIFYDKKEQGKKLVMALSKAGYSNNDIYAIINVMGSLDYLDGKAPNTIEGQITQDAKILDSLSAIGVLNVFIYGAKHNIPTYGSERSSLAYLIEKMNTRELLGTNTANEIAATMPDVKYEYLTELLQSLPDDIYEKKNDRLMRKFYDYEYNVYDKKIEDLTSRRDTMSSSEYRVRLQELINKRDEHQPRIK